MNYPTLKDGSRNWCATCKHNGEECEYGEECFYQENADGTYNHDLKPTHYDDKPQTNYDLIISKTTEELAKYLTQAWYDGPVFECPARASVGVDRCAEVKDCEDCFLDWLKSPVEEVHA